VRLHHPLGDRHRRGNSYVNTSSSSASRSIHSDSSSLVHNPPPTSTKVTSSSSIIKSSSSSSVVVPVPTSTKAPVVPVVTIPVIPLPTPSPTTLQPGTHTIPATTITVTEETTVCAATSTSVPAGTHTYGGVTTVVVTATTVVCPVATVSTSNGVTTSIIVETTYVCPSAGTYTIAPSTTTVTDSTVFVYPTPTTVVPGTYTQPAITTTITETDYVVYCPYTSSAAQLPVPTSTSPAPVQTSAVAVKPVPNKGGLGTNTDQWAITYTPYDQAGACKDAAAVLKDLADISSKGFTAVRLYSADKTDCNGLENVSAGCAAHGLQLIVGVYIKETGIEGAKPQITSLSTFTRWDLVILVVIGNESIFNGVCSAEELAAFITSSKQVFQGAGYTGPVTTTETLNVLQQHKDVLCGAIDVVGANIHPFFNSATKAEDAGTFVKGQLDLVDQLCPGKTGINLETGWPSAGICNGEACPGPFKQAAAIKSIREAVGGKSVVFSYHNDDWKNLGQFDCERSWGISSLFDIVGAVVDGVVDVVDSVEGAVKSA
jgi:exo-beta-1,3-glucanase (GH17 family)